jgi:hypothetical protein
VRADRCAGPAAADPRRESRDAIGAVKKRRCRPDLGAGPSGIA